MVLKRTLIALLALSVVFQGGQPWSGATREVSAESKAAAAKRKAAPRRVFSTRASVDPLTPEAVAFSEALAKSIPSRLTRQSLRKFTFKRAKSDSFVSGETKFSLNALASDRRSWARGVATVTAGDMFVAFIPSGNGLVGIVEAVARRVGKKKVDLKREAQLRATGFKVHLLVDRFQVVLWDSLDPEGIELTVAKAPTLITRTLSSEEVARLLIPQKGSVSSMSGASMMPPALIASVLSTSTVVFEESAPSQNVYLRIIGKFNCFFDKKDENAKSACPSPNEKITCDYGPRIGPFTIRNEKVFAASKEECLEGASKIKFKICSQQKLTIQPIHCPKPSMTPPTDGTSEAGSTEELQCPEARPAGVESVEDAEATECQTLSGIDCPERLPTSFTFGKTGQDFVCTCVWDEKSGPYCPEPRNSDIGCHYAPKNVTDKSRKSQTDCREWCATQKQKADRSRVECLGLEG